MPNIPIFLSSDNNYAPFVATTIASICDNTKSFCEFYILDGGISQENQAKICELKKQFSNFEIEFIKIDLENKFKNYKAMFHYTSTTYARLFIPDLKQDIKKVLYSDVDVIVIGDIKEMFEEDLQQYIIGAVPESFLGRKAQLAYNNTYNLSILHKPFSAGNLIIDCEKWRNQQITKQLLHIYHTKKEDNFNDQTLLNIYFDNSYKELHQKYCYTIQHDVCLQSKDIIICHYNGPIKPWHIDKDTQTKLMPFLEIFWSYAKKTAFFKHLCEKCDIMEQKRLLQKLKVFRIMSKKLSL